MSFTIRFSGSVEELLPGGVDPDRPEPAKETHTAHFWRNRTPTASDTETAPGSAPHDVCEGGSGFNVAVLLGVRENDRHMASASMAEHLEDQRAGGRCWARSMRGRTSVT